MISIKNLSKTFNKNIHAVQNVDLEIAEGEVVVIVGPSGSGKSTVLRCINRLEIPTEGSIAIDGVELTDPECDIDTIRAEVGMVFQQFNLFPHLTVMENICLAQRKVRGRSKSEANEMTMKQLLRVGIPDKADSYPRQLSGGQQQRVGIARSLAIEPDIWFLDEPFSALDPLIRKEMQDEFLRLQGVLNKTILFVTHDFDEALRLADRIAIMKDGVIEQLDTPANIVLNPATEYVQKFTEEVPREKVLKIESVMDPIESPENVGNLRVSKDAIIETVAEAVLSEPKAVSVVDANNKVVGILHPSKVISVLFGGRANNPSQ